MRVAAIGKNGDNEYVVFFEESENKYIKIFMDRDEFANFCKMVKVAESVYL